MLDVKSAIVELLTKSEQCIGNSPNGVSCYFIPLSDMWAVKIYWHEETRDAGYDWQEKAALHGLGPDVGEKFDLPEGTTVGEHRFCYITEIVETLGMDFFDPDGEMEWDVCDIDEHDEVRDLVDNLRTLIGFNFRDVHADNIGMKDGDLVCIDFAPPIFSFEADDRESVENKLAKQWA